MGLLLGPTLATVDLYGYDAYNSTMKTIEGFLGVYGNRATRTCYRSGVRAFIDFIGGAPVRSGARATAEEAIEYEKRAAAYLKGKRDRLDDLQRFAASMTAAKVPPWTARNDMKGIVLYLQANGFHFQPHEMRGIRGKMPKGGSRTIERDVDHEVVRSLLPHMPVHGVALTLVLASSGMRVGEALQLKMGDKNQKGDIDFETKDGKPVKPAVVTIRQEYTKTGNQRVTFISEEAVAAVREWLKIRDSYIRTAGTRNAALVRAGKSGERPLTDDRLFPFTDETYGKLWGHALERSGLLSIDNGTNRRTIHPHGLRRFFRSQGALRAAVDAIEHMMGHAGYLTNSYRRLSREQLAIEYQKAEPLLTVGVAPAAMRETEERVREQAVDIVTLQRENQKIREQLAAATADLSHMKETVTMLRGMVMVEEQAGRDEREILENATGTTLKDVLLREANEVWRRHGLAPMGSLAEIADEESQPSRRGSRGSPGSPRGARGRQGAVRDATG